MWFGRTDLDAWHTYFMTTIKLRISVIPPHITNPWDNFGRKQKLFIKGSLKSDPIPTD